MCEEKKDASVELTDEAVAEATGGGIDFEVEFSLVVREYTCPNCQLVYSFIAPMSVENPEPKPPDCPRCGYPGPAPLPPLPQLP